MWLPMARAAVLKVACPATRLIPPGVRSVAPSVKSTVPVGVPGAGATAPTVAVKVTAWPKAVGFGEDLSAVVLAPGLTTCGEAESSPWLASKLRFPL